MATCNCYHAAQAMYNRCAVPSARVDGMPNSIYTSAAKLLTRVHNNLGARQGSKSTLLGTTSLLTEVGRPRFSVTSAHSQDEWSRLSISSEHTFPLREDSDRRLRVSDMPC